MIARGCRIILVRYELVVVLHLWGVELALVLLELGLRQGSGMIVAIVHCAAAIGVDPSLVVGRVLRHGLLGIIIGGGGADHCRM